jgi:hypothetical protein
MNSNSNSRGEKEGRRRKYFEIKASRIENEIPLLNAFHVELNFLRRP